MIMANRRFAARGAALVGVTAAAVTGIGLAPATGASGNHFTVTPLVTDSSGAPTVDSSLVNPWGMSQGPNTPVWVSDNGTDVSTLYKVGADPKVPLTVKIPGGAPTGTIYNGSNGLRIRTGASTSPAVFAFASENGVLSGWNQGTKAVRTRTIKTAVFKGLAIATVSGHPRLYATDFHNGRVDMFNAGWRTIHHKGAFVDRRLPKGFGPFGITTLRHHVYVSYAKQDAARHDDVAGRGHGFVDVFTRRGAMVKRLISRGALSSPWGMVIGRKAFGRFGGDLLVGNFGDGRIHAYNARTGASHGTLRRTSGTPIVLPGLWGLLFGNGTSAPRSTLMFTSGPGGESHGRWGTITR